MTVLRYAKLQPSQVDVESDDDLERPTGPQRSISAAELAAGTFLDREAMIFDALPQATVVAFRDDDALQLNPAARQLLGLSREERLRSIADLHAFIQSTTSLARAYEGERPDPETIEARIDGVNRTLNVETAPLFSAGRLAGAVCTLRDVTDRALDDEMGDDLLGRAAHDLRTPLAALKASAQLVGRGFERLDVPARARTLALLLSQIDKLSSRIDDVLDAARIRRGRFDLEPEHLDVAAELRQIVTDLRAIPGCPPIELTAQQDLPCKGDRARLRQIVTRLVYELAERTTAGGIVIRAKSTGPAIEITVESSGDIVREPKKRTARRLAESIVTRLGGCFREEAGRVVLTLPRQP
ncbi:MAG: histidine kinase dimerization/phospho-acceptor domain-containing protein [Polyangiales bacterium]